jgi:hypothetical protein
LLFAPAGLDLDPLIFQSFYFILLAITGMTGAYHQAQLFSLQMGNFVQASLEPRSSQPSAPPGSWDYRGEPLTPSYSSIFLRNLVNEHS